MSPEFLFDPMLDASERLRLLPADRPTINILLYTDDPHGITTGRELTDLGSMIDHLHAHAPTFAQLELKWLSRNSSGQNHADNKLDADTLKKYDQVWFFGLHQINLETFTLGVLRGGPQSELDKEEIAALDDWMKINEPNGLWGGGVLMTGDHNQELPENARRKENISGLDNSANETYLGLGRALGRCVPRAGLLRQWEGAPTNRPEDSFNTQSFVSGVDLDDPRLQYDELPLQLLLQTFDQRGNPARGGLPHPLFFYKNGKRIQVFPDHLHEGAVIIPSQLKNEVWPKGKVVQPQPRIIARGLDNRDCRLLDIVAAYNGECAGVGRIVADSTWHHYVNENLIKFPPSTQEDSTADQIGQFYANLAIWLTPCSKRRQMAYLMFRWLVNHLFIQEELRVEEYNDDQVPDIGRVLNIGRAAYSILSQVAAPCEISELLQAVVPDAYREQFETLYFPERNIPLGILPSKEVILGYILHSYQQGLLIKELAGDRERQLDFVKVTNDGFVKAFKGHVRKITQVALEAQQVFNFKLF
jgi:hypothetical protein